VGGVTRYALDNLHRILGAMPGTIGRIPAAKFWEALLCVLWDTSLHMHSAVQIKWKQIDLDRGTLKCKNLKAELLLHSDTVAALRAINRPARELVFPCPDGAAALGTALRALWNVLSKGGDQ
jgi:hypothetical protein